MSSLPSILMTGASCGTGATHTDRFARRGHDLVLVVRNDVKMNVLGANLLEAYGVGIDIIRADLTRPDDIRVVEQRLRDDSTIDSRRCHLAYRTQHNGAGSIGQCGRPAFSCGLRMFRTRRKDR